MVLENLMLKGLILNQLNPSNVNDRVDPKKAFNEENKKNCICPCKSFHDICCHKIVKKGKCNHMDYMLAIP